jgi:hypothetical protein
MKVRIGAGASGEEAGAIARALAERFGDAIEVYVGDDDAPVATADPSSAGDRAGRDAFPVLSDPCASL